MTKVEQPKRSLPKPPKPISRLGELAATRVVSAGEAFERDLAPSRRGASLPAEPASQHTPQPKSSEPPFTSVTPKPQPVVSHSLIKRTFRYPKSLDGELKRLVHRYNLEKREDEPELTMEELGVLMAKHFLGSDPSRIAKDSRGL